MGSETSAPGAPCSQTGHREPRLGLSKCGDAQPGPSRPRGARRHSPLEQMVPSSYFLTSTTSTKSLGEMSLMAAEGVAVLVTHRVCQGRRVIHIHGVLLFQEITVGSQSKFLKTFSISRLQEICDY